MLSIALAAYFLQLLVDCVPYILLLHPSCSGTTLPFIWPPPHHIQSAPDFEEPVLPFPPPESLLVREMELDAFR